MFGLFSRSKPLSQFLSIRSISTAPGYRNMSWNRLLRFHPKSAPDTILVGEPLDTDQDVGNATHNGEKVAVAVYSGKSILDAGDRTDKVEEVERLLSPLSQQEVGTIRCIGLNYAQHAAEARLDLPTVPVVFLKPSTSLADPYPAPTIIPACTKEEQSCDYESELTIVIGKTAKNISESKALDYVLGYTASNDVSARRSQFAQSQWSYSKGFDAACPIGPVVASTRLVPEPTKLHIKGHKVNAGEKEKRTLQDCPISDMVFSVAKLVSFLSQGTTLPAGTIILTGTPAGIGGARKPKEFLKEGDEFGVELSGGVGTLWTKFEDEKL